mmetsp:Transcript_30027/g.62781  ORF Transcript_30027/g.62781 Transcript_30027/m.62781 type:complete len:475 (+) Transcript_30027:104-1528(+)
MNVSSQSLRRRQSSSSSSKNNNNNNNDTTTNKNTFNNRPLRLRRRVGRPNFKKRSSFDRPTAHANANASSLPSSKSKSVTRNNDNGNSNNDSYNSNETSRKRARDNNNTKNNNNNARLRSTADTTTTIPNNNNKVLEGVVACLSGQTQETKQRIQTTVSKLGGRTMGRFDPRYVTHLVLDDIVGSSKYENWKRHYDINLKCTAKTWKDGEEDDKDDDRHHRQTTKTKYEYHEWADKLKVVTSAWVDACLAEGRRVDEEDYRLKEEGEGGGDENYLNEEQSRQALPATIRNASSEDKCDWMIQQQQQQRQCPVADDEYCNLFSRHSFILVGFDNDNDDDEGSATNTNNNNDNNDTTTIPTVDNVESSKVVVGDIHRESHMENSRAMTMTTTTTTARVSGVAIKQEDNRGLPSTSTSSTSSSLSNDKISTIRKKQSEIVKGKISKLIRRAGGTIFWEPNEWISIVVLNDHYSKRTW